MQDNTGKLGFVVPFISRQLSKDWGFQNQLLKRTIASLLNQESDDFVVTIVGHDKPLFDLTDGRVHWIQVDFPLELSDRDVSESTVPDLEIKWTDRGRKLFRGIEHCKTLGATHILPTDSDDLVNRNLATIVRQNPYANGWFMQTGYRYYEGSRLIRYKPKDFYKECGTGTILRTDAIPIPTPIEYDRGYSYYRFLINHAYIADKMEKADFPLSQLNFPGAVYVVHSDNFFAKRRREGLLHGLWDEIKNITMSRYLSQKHIQQFGSFKLPNTT